MAVEPECANIPVHYETLTAGVLVFCAVLDYSILACWLFRSSRAESQLDNRASKSWHSKQAFQFQSPLK